MHPTKLTGVDRRWLLKAGSASMVLALTACQSVGGISVGEATAASRTGESYLRAIRAQHSLQPVRSDPLFEQAALQQANYMARSGRMAHTTGRGRDLTTRLRALGITEAAENIAFRVTEPSALFSLWMNSPGHRRNILNPRFSRFGLAYAGNPRSPYWALIIGR
jgi:uncharacterized protein YkwD